MTFEKVTHSEINSLKKQCQAYMAIRIAGLLTPLTTIPVKFLDTPKGKPVFKTTAPSKIRGSSLLVSN